MLHLSYDGTKYHGWQRQVKVKTVQETLEHYLSEVLKQDIRLIGCGRTDAGVHATQYFAHFDIEEAHHVDFLFRINKRLPGDIAIHGCHEVELNSHARFDVLSRSYSYFVHLHKTPSLSMYSGLYPHEIKYEDRMVRAIRMLLMYNEYRAYCRRPDKMNTTICHFSDARLYTYASSDRWRFDFTANRFLTGMIRLLVGELLAIGQGLVSLESFAHHLSTGDTLEKHRAVDPQGLHLTRVVLPYLNIKPISAPFDIDAQSNGWVEMH